MRAASSRSPPFRRYSAMPVPRKLWAQISRGRPALRARRLIIRSAVARVTGRSRNASFRPGGQGRKRGPRRSSPISAAAEAPHAGLVRPPDVPARQRIALMGEMLERHREALETQAVVTVRDGRIRVSRPLRRSLCARRRYPEQYLSSHHSSGPAKWETRWHGGFPNRRAASWPSSSTFRSPKRGSTPHGGNARSPLRERAG